MTEEDMQDEMTAAGYVFNVQTVKRDYQNFKSGGYAPSKTRAQGRRDSGRNNRRSSSAQGPGWKARPSTTPDGYDPEFWEMAGWFQKGAEWAKVDLRETRPLIYFQFAESVEKDSVINSEHYKHVRRGIVKAMIEKLWNEWHLYDLNRDNIGREALNMMRFHWNDIREHVFDDARWETLNEKMLAAETEKPAKREYVPVDPELHRKPEELTREEIWAEVENQPEPKWREYGSPRAYREAMFAKYKANKESK